jgi:hypothetical protein
MRSNWKPTPSMYLPPAALGLIRQRIEPLGNIGARPTPFGSP